MATLDGARPRRAGRRDHRGTLRMIAGIAAIGGLGAAVEMGDRFALLRLALQFSASGLPSTTVLEAAEVQQGLPLLSLSVDDPDLRDPARGILTNRLERGRVWERAASVSYIDRGRLIFGGLAGIRVHGDGSRRASAPQSYRLYFRRMYGTPYLTSHVLFEGEADPVRSLVIHNDRRRINGINWHLTNPLAYDIARQVGIRAPLTKPVRLFLNGGFEGVYVITEHLGPGFFHAHYGHAGFFASEESQVELFRWARGERRLTMTSAAARVDLDNLTRWFIAHVFCDTLDAFQTPSQFRDQVNPGGRWFWIPWDMDQSFRRWDRNSIETMLQGARRPRPGRFRYDPRSTIILRLLEGDREYREYFKQLWDETLNHRLTPEFLNERFDYYAAVAREYGATSTRYQPRLRDFLDRRPAFLRGLVERVLKTGPSVNLELRAPSDLPMTVDGFAVGSAYTGRYFPGGLVSIRVDERPGGPQLSHWLVDGSMRVASTLTLQLQSNTTITAVAR